MPIDMSWPPTDSICAMASPRVSCHTHLPESSVPSASLSGSPLSASQSVLSGATDMALAMRCRKQGRRRGEGGRPARTP